MILYFYSHINPTLYYNLFWEAMPIKAINQLY